MSVWWFKILDCVVKIYFLEKMKICIYIKIIYKRNIIILERRYDYEFDLNMGYIGVNLLYEERR